MKIGQRIKERRKELGLTVDELAEKLDKNRATIYRYESNDIEKLPTTILEPLAKALETTPAHLMGWEDWDKEAESFSDELARDWERVEDYLKKRFDDKEMRALAHEIIEFLPALDLVELKSTNAFIHSIKESDGDLPTTLQVKYRTLDGYGKKAVDDLLDTEAARCEEQRKARFITFTKCSIHKASAGAGFDLNDPDVWKEIQVKDSEAARRADFAVEVDGDSMETTYHDGDIVYIVLDRDVPIGDVGLFTYENKGYIKERGDGCLISHNPKYDDIKPKYGSIESVGRVIGVAELAE